MSYNDVYLCVVPDRGFGKDAENLLLPFEGDGLLAVILIFLAVYFGLDSSTPPGQEPLVTLTTANFAAFEESFDKSTEGPRLVLLLSPT